MRFRDHALACILMLSLALVGCGKQGASQEGSNGASMPASAAAPKQHAVPGSLAELVPTNAVGLLYVKSARTFEASLKRLLEKIDPEMASGVDFGAMVGSMLMDQADQWDMEKPMAIAVALPPEGAGFEQVMNGVSMIFGMKDAAAAKKALDASIEKQFAGAPAGMAKPGVQVEGDFLTISQGPGGPRGGCRLATAAPDADVALRLDLAAIVARYRKDIDGAFGKMEEGMSGKAGDMPPGMAGLGDAFKGIAGGLKDFMNAADILDLGVSVDGDAVEIAVGFAAKAGSKLDVASSTGEDLAAMAALLPEGMPLNLLVSMDMGKLMDMIKPLMASMMKTMPEDGRAKFQAYWDETVDMSRLLGPNAAESFGFSPEGAIEAVAVMECKDTATYLKRMEKLITGGRLDGVMGMSAKATGTTTVAGVEVHSYTMTIDVAKMMAAQGTGKDLPKDVSAPMTSMMQAFFGGEGLQMHVAALDGNLIMAMGRSQRLAGVIEAVRTGGTAPAAVSQAMARAGGTPSFLLQMDARALARQFMGLARKAMDKHAADIPEIPAGRPIPVTVWGKHDGRVYGGGLRVDVGAVVELVHDMKK